MKFKVHLSDFIEKGKIYVYREQEVVAFPEFKFVIVPDSFVLVSREGLQQDVIMAAIDKFLEDEKKHNEKREPNLSRE